MESFVPPPPTPTLNYNFKLFLEGDLWTVNQGLSGQAKEVICHLGTLPPPKDEVITWDPLHFPKEGWPCQKQSC